ncbi:MAG: hypothetical protein FJ405_03760 [Verrucomicrobia bacterium]|nr:hypothetical protein [Verrucomicrobiota bacterium]
MKLKVLLASVAILSAAVMFSGCATNSSSRTSSASAGSAASAPPYGMELIRPGDLLTVTFSDLPPQSGIPDFKDRVKDDGSIILPLGVKVEAAGKTTGALQQTIEASYVPRFFRRLTVSIKSEERFYFVGGEVRQPNRQIYATGITVLQAIDSASGFTEFANRKKVVLRRVNGQQFRIDCTKALEDHTLDLPVFPGDSINVPKRIW